MTENHLSGVRSRPATRERPPCNRWARIAAKSLPYVRLFTHQSCSTSTIQADSTVPWCSLIASLNHLLTTHVGHWDPKITTLPGLYAFAVAYDRLVSSSEKLLSAFGAIGETDGSWQGCGERRLRQVNWAFSLGTLYLIGALLGRHMVSLSSLTMIRPTASACRCFLFRLVFRRHHGASIGRIGPTGSG